MSSGNTTGQGGNFSRANVSFIDDDNIASYYLSINTDGNFVSNIPPGVGNVSLDGPRGTSLTFDIQASTDLATSTYLFEQLGSTGITATGGFGVATPMRYIDSVIKVTGATTGYTLNIPVRYIKKV